MTTQQNDNSVSIAENLSALEKLVVDNDDLLSLESLIGRFNIFDALNIAQVEIRHSNFLAFILDPAESHGQGQLFLKALLMDLLKSSPLHLRPLSPIDLDGTDLHGVEVRREWRHIDLLITCQQPPFAVVIENKVRSHEHSQQLVRYQAVMLEQFSKLRPLYVYLTPNGEAPSDETWIPYSYADIHRVLSRIRTTYNNAIGEDVLVFVDHYLSLIGTRFMNDAKIDELCQRIYKNHRQALTLIFERAGNLGSGVLADTEAMLRDDPRWHVFYRMGTYIDFVPKAWLEWLPTYGLDRKEDPRSWIVLRFEVFVETGKLDYYVEVRRMADLVKRREIVEKLIEEGQKFGFKHSGREVRDNYTRVSGRERLLKWNTDNEPESNTIRAAVRKKLDEVFKNLEELPSVLMPLLAKSESKMPIPPRQ